MQMATHGWAVLLAAALLSTAGFAQDSSTSSLRTSAPDNGQASSAQSAGRPVKIKTDKKTAYELAADRWFYKAAAADPSLVAAVCAHKGPATLLAQNPHIDKVAEADHYLCRRLTRWPSAAVQLVKNPAAATVLDKDPEGIYRAIARNAKVGRLLAKHVMFDYMVMDNPDLGKVLARHMR